MSTSYFIEGVGDEVIVVLGVIIGLFIVIVSWMSTWVNDAGSRQFEANDVVHAADIIRVRPSQQSTQAEPQPTNANDTSNFNESENAGTSSDISSDSIPVQSPIPTETESNLTETVLRQRHGTNFQPSTTLSSAMDETATSQPEQEAAVVPDGNTDLVKIKLKFMDDTLTIVEANPDETMDSFRRRTLPPETESRFRLIYCGQVLRERSRTLRDYNLHIGTGEGNIPVVHCFLSTVSNDDTNRASSASRQIEMNAEELHIGSLLLPVIGVILLGLWYLCIFQTSLFSIQSLVSIVGLTLLFIVLLVNSLL